MTPLVSIIVPAYNAAGTVERAVASALDQTMSELEVVIVDDGSGDATYEVALELARRDARVRVLRHETNRGTSRAFNFAVRNAQGIWVGQLDADDSWLPERLERLLAFGAGADVVADDIEIVRDEPMSRQQGGFRPGSMLEQVGLQIASPRRLELIEFLRTDPGLVHPLIRRGFLLEHDLGLAEDALSGADFGLWALLLAHGARWVQLPEAFYVYTRAPNAMTRNLDEVVTSALKVSRSLATHPMIASWPGATRALKRRERLFRGHLAHRQITTLLAERRLRRLGALLLRRPSYVPLVLWRKSVYLRIRLGKRRRSRELTPALSR